MIIEPRLKSFENGSKLTLDSLNSIIKRIEYAGDLIKKNSPVAGTDILIEQQKDGKTVSYLGRNMRIGLAASTGGLRATQTVSNFVVNNELQEIEFILGSATKSGLQFQLTNNLFNQAGAIWSYSKFSSKRFSASFDYSIGGSSQADGFTIIFCNSFFIAGAGGGLGYDGGPIKSVAVEIDIYKNEFDPNNSHVAVLSNGIISTHLALSSPTVRPSGTLRVEYSNNIMNVIHNGIQIISYPINISSIID